MALTIGDVVFYRTTKWNGKILAESTPIYPDDFNIILGAGRQILKDLDINCPDDCLGKLKRSQSNAIRPNRTQKITR